MCCTEVVYDVPNTLLLSADNGLGLNILYSLFLKDLFGQGWEGWGQLLLVAQQHYRVTALPHSLWSGGKLFKTAPHEVINICDTQLPTMERKPKGSFWCVFLSLKFIPSLCCSHQSHADPSQWSAVQRENGLGPRSDHQWSPRRLHVPACCTVGGMKWTKQQCRLDEGGPLTSSAVHHIIEIPISASLSKVLYSLAPKCTIPYTNPAHQLIIILFVIQLDLWTWLSTHRLDSYPSPQLITVHDV